MKVNGKERAMQAPVTLEAFLEQEGYRKDRIAVELNGSIIPKANYADTILSSTDVLEVVSFVGGG
ncbi:MAG TPA: sulfur carrier protein ThiS [Candidatus Blautia gallistercoris]|uniref:Sulfur carrier protein ThiS n=1 Tax=Candidatus Blautia gallistercoris TaxID=2838490 RepID=A0A9D2B3T7_9FIRM|nr:sulfur carrier protein ThiS [Candidatus Blautia gallistercoris]